MKIAIASDHRGYSLKQILIAYLKQKGNKVFDLGPDTEQSCDYPKFAFLVSDAVSKKKAERGILICNSGLGMTMAANKKKGIRAANCFNLSTARFSREHNDANILVLSAAFTSKQLAKRIVSIWLKTKFSGGRHLKRIKMFSR